MLQFNNTTFVTQYTAQSRDLFKQKGYSNK